MDFRPLNTLERADLLAALRGNVEQGKAIFTDPRNTGFVGTGDASEVTDDEVINAIRSVPTHY